MSWSLVRCRTRSPDLERSGVKVVASGINPGDLKKRQDFFGYGMPYPRVITPQRRWPGPLTEWATACLPRGSASGVWCYGAQSYRPFGTAAEFVVVPAGQAVPLSDGVSFEQGACLGIPGITAHRCVHAAGPVAGRVLLVQGGAGAVGRCAVQLARRAGASVLATVRSADDEEVASRAGAHEVIRTGGFPVEEVVGRIRRLAPEGSAISSRSRLTRTSSSIRMSWRSVARWPPTRPGSLGRRCPSGSCCSRTSGCSSWAATTSRPRPKLKQPAS